MRLTTHYDDQLFERPDDPDQLREAIAAEREDLANLRAALQAESNELDRTRLGRTLNRLCDYLRLNDEPDAAREAGREALAIWKELERRKAAFLARLRLAKVERRAGAPADALDILADLIDSADDDELSIYRDFALEARALCHCGCGSTEDALADLDRALELRVERGSKRQIEATRRLIERVTDTLS